MRKNTGKLIVIVFLSATVPLLVMNGLSNSNVAAQPTILKPGATCQIDPGAITFTTAGYCFLKGLIHPTTKLVRSREGECFTTVYKNALAVMAFIHEGDLSLARGIFDFFKNKLPPPVTTTIPITGFLQAWDPCNGQAINDPNNRYWEGDNALLLLALNYYGQVAGNYGEYNDLAITLKKWLTERTHSSDKIVAEGTANMYAALEPFGGDLENWETLSRLYKRFYSDIMPYKVDYPNVLDHAVRGSLVFGDETGFNYLNNFSREELWQCNQTPIRAYSETSADNWINVEISAQLLLAWRIWRQRLTVDLSPLRAELEKLRLFSMQTTACSGLPYHVRDRNFPDSATLPIVDPTAYLLYDYWNFNPFAPGRMNAGCSYDRFVPLETVGQQQGFPRLFDVNTVNPDPSQFPQEINDGNHENIVIQFTVPPTLSLFTIPLTLTIDTVNSSNFGLRVRLDNGDHCLADFEPNMTSSSGNAEVVTISLLTNLSMPYRLYLPIVIQGNAFTPSSPSYQLILEGTSGYGVFDWLQLETPSEILWTIGNKDNRCIEFDNTGFTYQCN